MRNTPNYLLYEICESIPEEETNSNDLENWQILLIRCKAAVAILFWIQCYAKVCTSMSENS